MKRILTSLFIFSILATGCKDHSKSKAYGTTALSKDDSTFLVLKDSAQKKIKMFADSLDVHGMDYKNYRFLVKSDFVDGDKHEHMWSRIYKRNNDVFIGTFIDSAYDLKNIKTGDSVAIGKNDIEDWSIANQRIGKTFGEFSLKYLRSKMQSNSN